MKLVSFIPFLLATIAPMIRPSKSQNLQDGNICQIMTFIPFSDLREGPPENDRVEGVEYYGYGQWPNAETLAKASFSLMAAAEMAKRHFNERNNVIVTDLLDVIDDCTITLGDTGAPYFDSAYNRKHSVQQYVEVQRQSIQSGGGPGDSICAVVGPVEPRANEGVSSISESINVPQSAYATIDKRLSRQADFPTFVRVIPEAEDFANTIAKYVNRDAFVREYLGIIYDQSDYGEQFEDPLENFEDTLGFESLTEHFIQGDRGSIEDGLGEVIANGYRTVVLIPDRSAVLHSIAEVAEEYGMLNGDYLWIISGDAISPAMMKTVKFEADSPIDKLIQGAAFFTNYDRFVYLGEDDPFLSQWRKQSSSMIRDLNEMQPIRDNGDPFYVAEPTYFRSETPTEYASFMYDAVMATGIGACRAQASKGKIFLRGDKMTHHDMILQGEFQGASGPVKFKKDEEKEEYKSGRDPSGVLFGMYNVRPGPVGEGNLRGYETVLVSLYSEEYTFVNDEGKEEHGAWVDVDGTSFVFADTTNEEPMPLRTVSDPHYLSKSAQIVGMVLVAIALFISFSSGLWVFLTRKHAVIKAAQPEFLYLMCFGASLVACSTVFISFDEGKGWDEEKLSKACSMYPWFFVIGYLTMYCALFSKLWRLSKLLQMRRRAVQMQQVLWPFMVIIASSLIVLIVWQVIDPLTWTVDVISMEPLETFGQCQSTNYGLLPFIIPLGILFAVIMAMTAVIAWKLKEVQAELSESRWIFFGILTHIQTWAMGIPIAVITSAVSKDAFYIMFACLAFIFSVSLVALVIWPKMFVWVRDEYFGGPPKNRNVSVTVGSTRGSTRVSGLMSPSSSGSAFATSGLSSIQAAEYKERIAELESQMALLTQKGKDAQDTAAKKNAPE